MRRVYKISSYKQHSGINKVYENAYVRNKCTTCLVLKKWEEGLLWSEATFRIKSWHIPIYCLIYFDYIQDSQVYSNFLGFVFAQTSVREGNGTPLQYSCLENPMDGGAWKAAVHGVAEGRHDWATSLSLFTFMHWRRKWQPTPVFLPGESQGRGSLEGCRLWGHTESDTTEVT